jgi:WD40 repeat protein
MNNPNNKRRRGVILTVIGREKLLNARSQQEQQYNHGVRYTIEQLSEITVLSTNTLNKIFLHNTSVDLPTLNSCFTTLGSVLDTTDYEYKSTPVKQAEQNLFWGEAPDVSIFYGRSRELQTLTDWIQNDRCRLLSIVGMGGMGKTSLATFLARQLQSQFTTVCWLSLRNAPALKNLLASLIQICSQEKDTVTIGSAIFDQISQLLEHLRQQRCLIILDNVEAILESNNIKGQAGEYRSDYEEYGNLFERISTSSHQSCLVLTSREKPGNIAYLAAEDQPIRILSLTGLDLDSSNYLFDAKALSASPSSREKLVEIYNGNPLALKIVATTIDELFDRNIDAFLAEGTFIFDEIRQLFDRQFKRLSRLEQIVMYWLAIERRLITLKDLHPEIIPAISKADLLETMKSLGRRCLIEQNNGRFTQQPVIIEYMTDRLINQVCAELQGWTGTENLDEFPLWWSHPFVKNQSPEHIRISQQLQILEPIIDQLLRHFGSSNKLQDHFHGIIASLQTTHPNLLNYGGGNLFNLLQYLQVDFTGYDFSSLAIWQTDLQGLALHDVNLTGADLSQSLLTKTFGRVYATAVNADTQILATSDDSGTILLWQIADQQPIGRLFGHTNFAWDLMFIPEKQILVSAGQDGKIGIWDLQRQENHCWLQADNYPVHSISYNETKQVMASGHGNGRVRIWSMETWTEINTLHTHEAVVYALPVQFSPDGLILATGSLGEGIELWKVDNWQLINTLKSTTNQFFYTLTFNYDGQKIVGGGDGQLIIWDVATGTIAHQLPGHQNRLISLAAAADNILASGSVDTTIRIWDLQTGRLLKTIAEHNDWIWSLQFSAVDNLLISGSADQSIRFWDMSTWQCAQVWKGYNNAIWAMTYSGDSTKLITGSQDGCVRVWDIAAKQVVNVLQDREGSNGVWAVDCYSDLIASSDGNGVVRIWNETGNLLHTWAAHQGTAWSTKFSPDGTILATAGIDSRLCFWSMTSKSLLLKPIVVDSIIRTLCFSPDGQFLATANFDGCWRIWEVATGELLSCHAGHSSWLWAIDFSTDGRWIATGSSDHTVKLWDALTGALIHTFTGHSTEVSSVKFNPDLTHLAACSNRGEIYIWDITSKEIVRSYHDSIDSLISFSPDGRWLASSDDSVRLRDWLADMDVYHLQLRPPYDHMNISDAKGLTPAAISTLKTLGACASGD